MVNRELIGRVVCREKELVLFLIVAHSAFSLLILQESVSSDRPRHKILAQVGAWARKGEADSRYGRIRGIRVVEGLQILGGQGSHGFCLGCLILKISEQGIRRAFCCSS